MSTLEHLEKIVSSYSTATWQERGVKLLARQFKTEQLPMPKVPAPNWQTIHLQFEKVMIEIGCGAGHHPYHYAMANPKTFVFAIEHTKTRFKQMQNLMKEKGELANFAPIHENAISWIGHYVLENSIDEINLLYPNPYPKPKDWNCRWMATPFWGFLLRRLNQQGFIRMVTNIRDYAEQSIYFNQVHWPSQCQTFQHVKAGADRTLFEKKYLERGETCFEMIFTSK